MRTRTWLALAERDDSDGPRERAMARGDGLRMGSCCRPIIAMSSWREMPLRRFSTSKAYGKWPDSEKDKSRWRRRPSLSALRSETVMVASGHGMTLEMMGSTTYVGAK